MTTDQYDAAYMDVMGRQVGDTCLKNLDLYLLGETVLNVIGTCQMLGHTSPAHSLDYFTEPVNTDHVSKHIVEDLLAWVGHRPKVRPGCEERLRAWVTREWLPEQTAKMGRLWELPEPAVDGRAVS